MLKAQAALAEQGFCILLPLTEHSPFDLVVYKDNRFRRVQVKYRSSRNGVLEIPFSSAWADKKGNHVVPWDKAEVDIVCVYCPETDVCYYFDPSKFGKSVRLRVSAPKNNQKVNVKMADDYREVP